MATWEDLSGYIRLNYGVAREEPGELLQLGFQTGEKRTHMVVVSLSSDGAQDWAQLEAPVGNIGDVDIAAAAQVMGDALCGGLIAHDGMLLVRHAVPLNALDVDEFDVPLRIVVSAADALEMRFTGADDF